MRDIVVSGTILSVTKNLFDALGYLRDAVWTRTLWIDALCINQKDDAEKNTQVAMMGRIYSQASKVMVWLMKSKLPGLLDDIASFSQNPERHFTEFPAWFLTLSSNDWWYRAWTFQEAVLAKNLIFYTGTGSFSCEDLAEYCNSFSRHLFEPLRCCSAVYATASTNKVRVSDFSLAYARIQYLVTNRQIAPSVKRSLLDLILNNRVRLATRPQDKVYAYLGLTSDVPADLVKYELPLREWNLHISAKLIQHDMSLKVVHLAARSGFNQIDMDRMARLPSWCPDWTQTIDSGVASILQARYESFNSRGFAASRQTKAIPCFPRPEILGVSGVVCDTVARVAHDDLYSSEADDTLQYMRQWCHFVVESTFVHDAICNECDKTIYGIRKKCLSCLDFDLCGRCFAKSSDIHPGHSFSGIDSPDIEMKEHGDGEIANDSSWERLDGIAYPFGDGETLQDALRKVITTDGHLDMLFNSSDHGIDPESREAFILPKIAFAKFWHMKIKNRPEEDFTLEEGYIEEGYTIEPGSLASRVLNESFTNSILAGIQALLLKRQLFVSSKGYIGWGPPWMTVGDTVAVLHGGNMPFILREFPEEVVLPDPDRVYNFVIGECYVQGLMRGEALENEEMEKRDFLLY